MHPTVFFFPVSRQLPACCPAGAARTRKDMHLSSNCVDSAALIILDEGRLTVVRDTREYAPLPCGGCSSCRPGSTAIAALMPMLLAVVLYCVAVVFKTTRRALAVSTLRVYDGVSAADVVSSPALLGVKNLASPHFNRGPNCAMLFPPPPTT